MPHAGFGKSLNPIAFWLTVDMPTELAGRCCGEDDVRAWLAMNATSLRPIGSGTCSATSKLYARSNGPEMSAGGILVRSNGRQSTPCRIAIFRAVALYSQAMQSMLERVASAAYAPLPAPTSRYRLASGKMCLTCDHASAHVHRHAMEIPERQWIVDQLFNAQHFAHAKSARRSRLKSSVRG